MRVQHREYSLGYCSGAVLGVSTHNAQVVQLCCTPESHGTLCVNYTSIPKQNKTNKQTFTRPVIKEGGLGTSVQICLCWSGKGCNFFFTGADATLSRSVLDRWCDVSRARLCPGLGRGRRKNFKVKRWTWA